MNSTQSLPPNVDVVIAEFLKASEAGDVPTTDQILAEHPTLAAELQEFFDDKERIDQLANPQIPLHSKTGNTEPFFGDYELLEEIARGGMGAVFKARQISLNRIVALKMILAGSLASEAEVQRFQIEAEAAAKLDHPGIVPIYEIGQHNGQHYFSMAYITGPSLAEYLAKGPIPPRQAAEWIQSLARAVSFAHEAGVIHRDLKPGNILLAPKESEPGDNQNAQFVPKISDFGLAKKSEAECSLTQTGQIIGTPNYMAPEQISGGSVGVTSDLYSLGSILYTMLTGRPPFHSSNQIETMNQVVDRDPPSTKIINSSIPHELDTICMKLLAKEPERRYQTGFELATELQLWLDGKPIKAKPVGHMHRTVKWCQRNPIVASLLATTLVAMIISVGAFLKTSQALASSESHLYEKQILLAAAEFDSGHRNQAIWTLKATEPEKRGWEYHHLMRRCYPQQFSFLEESVQVCFFSRRPRGIRQDGTILDLQTREIIQQHQLFELLLESPNQFPAPGRFAIGRNPDNHSQIKIVDIANDHLQGEVVIPNNAYDRLVVTPDGNRLISISQVDSFSTWTIWSVNDGKQIATFRHEWSVVEQLSMEKDQILLRSLEGSTEYLIGYDLVSGNQRVKIESKGTEILRYFGDNLVLKLFHNNRPSMTVCQTPKGRFDILKGASQQTGPMSLSRDGNYMAIVLQPANSAYRITEQKATLQIWRCSDWTPVGEPLPVDGSIQLPTFGQQENQIYCAVGGPLERPSLIAWDWEKGDVRSVFDAQHPEDGRTVNPFYNQLLIDSSNGQSPRLYAHSSFVSGHQGGWFVWQTAQAVGQRLNIDQKPSRILFSDDGQSVGLLQRDGKIVSTYQMKDGNLEEAVLLDNQLKQLLKRFRNRLPVSLTAKAGEEEIRHKSPDGKNSLVFRPPVNTPLLGFTGKGELSIHTPEKGTRTLNEHSGILTTFAFSNDGRLLATASTSESMTEQASLQGATNNWKSDELQQSALIRIWHVRSGRLIHTMRGHSGLINDLCFSPDKKRLVSVGSQQLGSTVNKLRGGQAILWDVGSGRKLLVLPGSQGDFTCVDFSPDGTQLVAAGTRLYLWSGKPQQNALARQPDSKGKTRDRPKDILIAPNQKKYLLHETDLTKRTFERLSELPAIDQITVSLKSSFAENTPIQFPRPLNNLESLTLYKKAGRESLDAIGNSKNLTSVNLLGGVSIENLPLLLKCDALHQLSIRLKSIDALEQLTRLHNLRSLSTNFLNPTTRSISVGRPAAQGLRNLELKIFRDAQCELKWLAEFEQLQSLTIDATEVVGQDHNAPNKKLDWSFCSSIGSLTDLSFNAQTVTIDDVRTLLGFIRLERIKIRSQRKLMIQLDELKKLNIPQNLIELQLPLYVVDGPNRTPVPKTVVLKCLREKCPKTTLHFRGSTWEAK